MKERPILFSAPMVRAILSGAKTQTRRILKQPKRKDGAKLLPELLRDIGVGQACPYGAVGDRLWVRETWAPHADEGQTFINYHAAKSGNGGVTEPGLVRPEIFYRADGGDPFINNWRPSIHIPRWASRINLEVTDVRLERLQEISEEDAKAEGALWHEGLKSADGSAIGHSGWRHDPEHGVVWPTARDSFFSLWERINGTESLRANPWVWVVSFRRGDGR